MSKRLRIILVLGLGILLFSLVAFYFPLTPYKSSQEAAIQETLVRQFMTGRNRIRLYKLTVNDDQEPSANLIQRLSDLHLSYCRQTSNNAEGEIVDSVSKQPASLCKIGKIRWHNAVSVEVIASLGHGLMDAHGAQYFLRRSIHGWTIMRTGLVWVS
jgi:hypothetical protein